MRRNAGLALLSILVLSGVLGLTPAFGDNFALQFDGDDEVVIPDDSSISFDSNSTFTIELWFMPTGNQGVYHILGKRDACTHHLLNYQMARDFASLLAAGSDADPISTGYDPPQNEWTYFAFAYDGLTASLYVNGELSVTTPYTVVGRNSTPLKIAASSGTFCCCNFIGLIDEVRIWNVARSQEEIQGYYNRKINPQIPGIVGCWTFDEDSTNQVALDWSLNGNNGALGADSTAGSDDPIRVSSTAPLTELQHDATIVRILVPDSIVALGTEVTPSLLVRNLGMSSDTIPIHFSIGSTYTHDSSIVLTPADSALITFPAWIANEVGTFVVACYSSLSNDEYANNDSIWAIIAVVDSLGPSIYSVIPNKGGNSGRVTVKITGERFVEGLTVRLHRGGDTDIIADSNSCFVIDSSHVSTTFDLTASNTGTWDIGVNNPDGHSTLFAGAFHIETGVKNLSVDIIGRNQVRVGRQFEYLLSVENSGNIDIGQAIVLVSTDALFRTDAPQAWPTTDTKMFADSLAFTVYSLPPGARTLDTLVLYSTEIGPISLQAKAWLDPLPSQVDPSLNSVTGRFSELEPSIVRYTSIAIPMWHVLEWPPIPPPEGSVVWQDDVQPNWQPGQENYRTGHEGIIWVDRDGELGSPGATYVWENLPPDGTRMTPWSAFSERTYRDHPEQCCGWQDSYTPPLSPAESDGLYQWLKEHSSNVSGGTALSYIPLSQMCTDAVHLAFTDGVGRNLISGHPHQPLDAPSLDYLLLTGRPWMGSNVPILWQIPGLVWDAYHGQLLNTAAQIVVALFVSSVGSWDPNDKTGPIGAGTASFVVVEKSCTYSVYFENIATATASADSIWITDTLDADLDWNTFEFGEVYPGDGPDSIRPNFNVVEDFDPYTGVITWGLFDINLPPDTMPYWGEGWVSYSVKPKANLPSGTRIENIAAIKFDVNDWILAPMDSIPIFNTIDAGTPSSSISPLPETTFVSTIPVSWTGSDEPGGSGVASYSLYCSIDNGPYELWAQDSLSDTADYTGSKGHLYQFYSVARDYVGHSEGAPTVPDARVYVAYICGDADASLVVNISDVVFLINYIFGGGPAPSPILSGDSDCSGSITISDAVHLINYIFGGGPQPCQACL